MWYHQLPAKMHALCLENDIQCNKMAIYSCCFFFFFCQQSSRNQIAMLCNASICSVGVQITNRTIQHVLCIFAKHFVQSPAHGRQKKIHISWPWIKNKIFLGKSSFSNHGPLVLIRSLVNRGYVVLIHSHILVVLVNRVHTVLLCSLVLVI